jgi:hypothetical protein
MTFELYANNQYHLLLCFPLINDPVPHDHLYCLKTALQANFNLCVG